MLAKTQSQVTPQELRQQIGRDTDDARADLLRLTRIRLLTHVVPDVFQLTTLQPHLPWDLTPGEIDVLNALNPKVPLTVQQLAEVTGRRLSGLRSILRGLVDSGAVVATAPPTSKSRAYLRATP